MNTEWLRRTAYTVFILLGGLILGYLTVKYLLVVLMPFLIAWAIAFAMRPVSALISERIHIRPKYVRPVLTGLAALLSAALVGVAVWQVSVEVWQIITEFGEGEKFRSFIENFLASGGIFDRFFEEFGTTLADVVYNAATSLLSAAFGILRTLISNVPKVFLFVIITLISTIYFAADLERINKAVIKALPKGWGDALKKFKDGFLSALLKYIRSYLIIFVMTFGIIITGLLILKIPYALVLALVISFFDLLPVIGVGTFLVPFGIFKLIIGNTYQGVGIIILLVIQTIIRQLAEPKILGKNLGVHPIVTLLILYVGYALFGIVGILLVPIFTVFIEIIFGKNNTADVKKREVSE